MIETDQIASEGSSSHLFLFVRVFYHHICPLLFLVLVPLLLVFLVLLLVGRLLLAVFLLDLAGLASDPAHEFVELLPVVPVQVRWVVCVFGIHPPFVQVLVLDELFHLRARRGLAWFLVALGQFGFPVGVDDVVVHVFVHLYHFRLPLVQVHRLDLRDVHLQLSVHARTTQTHECAEGYRRPTGRFRVTIRAFTVFRLVEEML